MYSVQLYRDAVKFLKSLDTEQQQRIRSKLKELTNWPKVSLDVKAMAGEFKGYYRVRIGQYRVMFIVQDSSRTIFVDHIGHRGDIY